MAAGVEKGNWLGENQKEVESRLNASPRETYVVTGTGSGATRTINRDAMTLAGVINVVATLIEDSQNT